MIREIRENELDGLLQLYTHLHDNPVPEKSSGLSALWQRIRQDPDHHIIIAEENEIIVSSCVCIIIPNLTRAQRPYALVENVVTHPGYRKRGYATACLAFAKQLAMQNNCYKISLMTGAKDAQTLHFYEQAGYNRTDKTAFIQWL